MASAQRNVDFVVEQMAEARDVSARKMFGEYGIYCRGKLIGLFCDDQLFIKPTDAGRAFLGTPKEAPPYPGAKPYFSISGDHCEDAEWLSELARLTEQALPAPTARAKRGSAEGAVKPKLAAKRSRKTAKTARKTSTKVAKPAAAKPAPKPSRRGTQRVSKKPGPAPKQPKPRAKKRP